MRQLLLLSLLLICSAWTLCLAQDRVITGRISSAEDGAIIPGASVLVKGTTRGTLSDAQGNYSISVPAGNVTLVYSFIGSASQEIVLGNQTTINVTLASESRQLTEVVITGYGQQIKRDLTGNIAQVKAKDIENMPVPSVDQALQGKAAGVFVNSGGGKLGQGVTVRVRGNSLSARAASRCMWSMACR